MTASANKKHRIEPPRHAVLCDKSKVRAARATKAVTSIAVNKNNSALKNGFMRLQTTARPAVSWAALDSSRKPERCHSRTRARALIFPSSACEYRLIRHVRNDGPFQSSRRSRALPKGPDMRERPWSRWLRHG